MGPQPLTILHVDMDAFYASVEQRDNPELRGKPVIVGGSAGSRGVVSAASYEARVYGVHSAMPTITARRLCPHGVFLPVRMNRYAAVARQLREIFFSFTPLVEPLSLDEAFLDVRGCEGLFGPAPVIARRIKDRIRQDTDLTASVGVATNKFLAKLASDLRKPDALVVLEPENVRSVMDPLPVGKLWGVGGKSEKRLHSLGIRTIGQLAALPEQILVDHWGDSGRHLWRLAHGLDGRDVVPDSEARSISTETTFARDIARRDLLRAWLFDLVEELGERVRRSGVRGRTVDLKVRSSDFRTFNRCQTLPEPTDVTAQIWQAAVEIFEKRVSDEWLPLRLIGVGLTNLMREGPVQGHLFEDTWRRKQRSVDQTVDEIRRQFGDKSIRRAGGRSNEPEK
jgi:DNA polymerase-4